MKNRIALIIILVVALSVRLGIGVFLGFNSGPDQAACGADTIEFEYMAWSASQGDGFKLHEGGQPTAFRAPGYPILLTMVYKVFGRQFWLNRVMLSLIGVATCWLLYILVMRMKLGEVTALIAAFINALLPLQFYWCGHFMSEPVSSFMNVALCLLLVIAYEKKSLVMYLLSGLVCGFSTLVRAACLLVPFAYGFLLLISRRLKFSRLIVVCLVFAVGTGLAIAPWAIRNRVMMNRFVLVSTSGGAVFWGANNDMVTELGDKWGGWVSSTTIDLERKKAEVWSLPNEADQDKKEWAIGKEYVRNNYRKMPLLLVGKFWRLIKPFPDSANKVYVFTTGVGWLFLFPFVLMGMVLVWRDKEIRYMFIPINAQILTLLVTVFVFYGSERFRMPYEPLLAIYVAVALVRLKAKLGMGKS